MLDVDGLLIYVGKAKDLRCRLLSYFRVRSRDRRARRIIGRTRAIAWESCPSEFGALLRELELIRRWRPRFNVVGQPHRRRRAYVCLGRKPALYAFLAQRPPAGVAAAFGPVPAGRTARESVRRFNDCFRLRDCTQAQTMVFADHAELFPAVRAAGCIRYEIGTCLGPCAAACSSETYAKQVRAAFDFLSGTDTALLESLEQDMNAAALAFAYERAAALRDKLSMLRWLHERLARVRKAREQHSFIYPVGSANGGALWYLIRGGKVEGVVNPPTDEPSWQAVAALIDQVYRSRRRRLRPTAEEIDVVFLVSGWFRRHPDQETTTLRPDELLALCADRSTSQSPSGKPRKV
jgi:excinuclease ABC subunit C